MSAPLFVLRIPAFAGYKARYYTARGFYARQVEKVRKVRDLGFGTEVTDTGVMRTDVIELRANADHEVRHASGDKSSHFHYSAQRTAAGVKECLRRVRPVEAVEIEQLDRQIAIAQSVLADLRERRVALVKDAWTKAHVVRLNEVEGAVR